MMMKLVFPAGDRPQMLLDQGVYRIGSGTDVDVALHADGIPLAIASGSTPEAIQIALAAIDLAAGEWVLLLDAD